MVTFELPGQKLTANASLTPQILEELGRDDYSMQRKGQIGDLDRQFLFETFKHSEDLDFDTILAKFQPGEAQGLLKTLSQYTQTLTKDQSEHSPDEIVESKPLISFSMSSEEQNPKILKKLTDILDSANRAPDPPNPEVSLGSFSNLSRQKGSESAFDSVCPNSSPIKPTKIIGGSVWVQSADPDESLPSGEWESDFLRPKFRSVTLESEEPWQPAFFGIDDDCLESKVGGVERIAETRKRLGALDGKNIADSLKPFHSALHSYWTSKQEL